MGCCSPAFCATSKNETGYVDFSGGTGAANSESGHCNIVLRVNPTSRELYTAGLSGGVAGPGANQAVKFVNTRTIERFSNHHDKRKDYDVHFEKSQQKYP